MTGPRKPAWLTVRLAGDGQFPEVRSVLGALGLRTVCQDARCPNLGDCWGRGTATIMILGELCTRRCAFCAVKTGNPRGRLDPTEPARVAAAVSRLGLRYVVLTSVDRDDLPDGGAAHFAATIRAVKEQTRAAVEPLVPDFCGDEAAIDRVLEARPDVFGHNLETVRRLTPHVRDRRAGYDRSLAVLAAARRLAPDIPTKSGLMVGLGETEAELRAALQDLRDQDVRYLTIGQYLSPTRRHLPVVAYKTPEEFARLRAFGLELGFTEVMAGPLVRSSYRAESMSVSR